jgi:UTP--glucose-1-phosphate uridylyltransferase
MKVQTGVIAAAGSGTRMFPVTLGYPKELLPIINKPAIHLIVDEFIRSGLKKIIIITGDYSEPLRRQYDLDRFPPRGKHRAADEFAESLSGIDLVFQRQTGSYGNGTPLICARPHIPEGEGFIYAYGDDIVKSEQPFAGRLIERHQSSGALVAGVQEVPWEDVVKYGVVEVEPNKPNQLIRDVVEKPSRAAAKSNLVMFGRFLLSHEVIQILSEIPRGKDGELWMTDAIREYVRRGGEVATEPIRDGRWVTIGDPASYLGTVIEYALDDPELRRTLEPQLRKLLES